MNNQLEAYIDELNTITILVRNDIYYDGMEFYIISGKTKKKLNIIYQESLYSDYKYVVSFKDLKLYKDYVIKTGNSQTRLKVGSVVRTKEFDELYYTNQKLGFIYTKKSTTFRCWSPVAKEIKIVINDKDEYQLKRGKKGVWSVNILGDLEGHSYYYLVRIEDEFRKTRDLYAISSDANSQHNYVIDINKTYKFKNKKPYFSGKYNDSIIYEASIADFTTFVTKKNCYLGMLEKVNNKYNAIDYIKSLGVTHVQFLPLNSFFGVDEKEKTGYNWGYNPREYMVPSGFYSEKPNDPYSRINELKKLVDGIHKTGLRVNLDVVYNHVYKVEDFPFNYFVPNYAYRLNPDMSLNNATGCGNVLKTESLMVRRFIKDSLLYLKNTFHFDGFRFDLMGLIDVDTMNEVTKALKKIDKTIMIYGEGWNMKNPLSEDLCAMEYNFSKMDNVSFFNGRYRDFLRGNQWNHSKGFMFGGEASPFEFYHLFLGSSIDYFKYDKPNRSLNYIECHDNYTAYDYAKYALHMNDDSIKESIRLGLAINVLSIGVPFIGGGVELFRTKGGVENSYNSSISINGITLEKFKKDNLVNTLKDLISIRKEYKIFRSNDTKLIDNKTHHLEALTNAHMMALLIEDDKCDLILVFKNDNNSYEINLNNAIMIFDCKNKCKIKNDTYTLSNVGLYIFRRNKTWN